jgi:hypothetical protein
MTHEDYRRALQAALGEYEDLGLKRREIDRRLAELAQTIGTLSRLLGHTPTVPMGLTEAIRVVMRGAGVPMTPVQIRERLNAIGFDLSKYSNDLAAIHTILKRLNDARELHVVKSATGKHQYAALRAPLPVVLSKDIVTAMYENAAERDAIHPTGDADPPASRRKQRAAPRTRRTAR